MRKTDIWIGVLCCFLLIACDGKKQKSLSVNDDNKSLTFTLPEVPIMLQSPEDRLNFMVQHYWDHFNFKDTAYIHVPDITEQALVDYMDLLNRVPSSLSDSCLRWAVLPLILFIPCLRECRNVCVISALLTLYCYSIIRIVMVVPKHWRQ